LWGSILVPSNKRNVIAWWYLPVSPHVTRRGGVSATINSRFITHSTRLRIYRVWLTRGSGAQETHGNSRDKVSVQCQAGFRFFVIYFAHSAKSGLETYIKTSKVITNQPLN
jgi:hypothetical protein